MKQSDAIECARRNVKKARCQPLHALPHTESTSFCAGSLFVSCVAFFARTIVQFYTQTHTNTHNTRRHTLRKDRWGDVFLVFIAYRARCTRSAEMRLLLWWCGGLMAVWLSNSWWYPNEVKSVNMVSPYLGQHKTTSPSSTGKPITGTEILCFCFACV